MRIESSGHSKGNPRLYELIEHAPKTGKSPTVWAWPQLVDYLKIAGQPVSPDPGQVAARIISRRRTWGTRLAGGAASLLALGLLLSAFR